MVATSEMVIVSEMDTKKTSSAHVMRLVLRPDLFNLCESSISLIVRPLLFLEFMDPIWDAVGDAAVALQT